MCHDESVVTRAGAGERDSCPQPEGTVGQVAPRKEVPQRQTRLCSESRTRFGADHPAVARTDRDARHTLGPFLVEDVKRSIRRVEREQPRGISIGVGARDQEPVACTLDGLHVRGCPGNTEAGRNRAIAYQQNLSQGQDGQPGGMHDAAHDTLANRHFAGLSGFDVEEHQLLVEAQGELPWCAPDHGLDLSRGFPRANESAVPIAQDDESAAAGNRNEIILGLVGQVLNGPGKR
jgi:hypothetical protein